MRQAEKSWQPVTGLSLPDPGVFNTWMNRLIVFLIATAITGAALIAVVIGAGVTALQKNHAAH